MTRGEFAEAVYSYCALVDGSATSWIRSQAHNAAVGGVSGSAHLFGLAVDVTYDTLVDETRRDQVATRCGLRRIVESDHDHLQPIGWAAG